MPKKPADFDSPPNMPPWPTVLEFVCALIDACSYSDDRIHSSARFLSKVGPLVEEWRQHGDVIGIGADRRHVLPTHIPFAVASTELAKQVKRYDKGKTSL